MARYIDADKVMEEIASTGGHNLCEWSTLGVKALIDRQPTADVAPRAEVAREIFEDIEKEITDALKSNYKVLPQFEESETLWNNVNGKINALSGIEYFIAELKKKYTEEKK